MGNQKIEIDKKIITDPAEVVTRIVFDGFKQIDDQIRVIEEKLFYSYVAIMAHVRGEPLPLEDIKNLFKELRMEPDEEALAFTFGLMGVASGKAPKQPAKKEAVK